MQIYCKSLESHLSLLFVGHSLTFTQWTGLVTQADQIKMQIRLSSRDSLLSAAPPPPHSSQSTTSHSRPKNCTQCPPSWEISAGSSPPQPVIIKATKLIVHNSCGTRGCFCQKKGRTTRQAQPNPKRLLPCIILIENPLGSSSAGLCLNNNEIMSRRPRALKYRQSLELPYSSSSSP